MSLIDARRAEEFDFTISWSEHERLFTTQISNTAAKQRGGNGKHPFQLFTMLGLIFLIVCVLVSGCTTNATSATATSKTG